MGGARAAAGDQFQIAAAFVHQAERGHLSFHQFAAALDDRLQKLIRLQLPHDFLAKFENLGQFLRSLRHLLRQRLLIGGNFYAHRFHRLRQLSQLAAAQRRNRPVQAPGADRPRCPI
jgi:hypothetical protein